MDRDPHERVLRRAGLSYEGQFEFAVVERWNIESLTGFVYTTSRLNRAILGIISMPSRLTFEGSYWPAATMMSSIRG